MATRTSTDGGTLANDPMGIGSGRQATGKYASDCEIAEARIHLTDRSVAWASANHDNFFNTAGFITFGSITDNGGGEPPNDPSFRHRRSYESVKIVGGLKVGSASTGFIDSIKAVSDSLYIYFQDDVYGIPEK